MGGDRQRLLADLVVLCELLGRDYLQAVANARDAQVRLEEKADQDVHHATRISGNESAAFGNLGLLRKKRDQANQEVKTSLFKLRKAQHKLDGARAKALHQLIKK
jgi:hypothetical protein